MSVYKRGKIWHVEVEWRGVGRIRATTRTHNKRRANAMERTLEALFDAGRLDLLGLLTDRRITLLDLHAAWQ